MALMQEKTTLEGCLSGPWVQAPGSWEWIPVSSDDGWFVAQCPDRWTERSNGTVLKVNPGISNRPRRKSTLIIYY